MYDELYFLVSRIKISRDMSIIDLDFTVNCPHPKMSIKFLAL